MTRSTIIGILIILIVCGNATAWLSGYDYRMQIDINNTGENLTYYQYNFTVNTESLVSAGKMQADGEDCRITNETDVLQEFWNESEFNSSTTKIWVNATALGNITNTTHYFYYGNNAASNASSGVNTFIQYGVLGIRGFWKQDEASWTGVNGEVKDETGVNNGTISINADTTSGIYGNAGAYDASNGGVNCGKDTSLNLSSYILGWEEKASSGDADILDLGVYNGKLYATTYPNGRLLQWNNISAWTQVAPKYTTNIKTFSPTVYNGNLYCGTHSVSGDGGELIMWNGVDGWTLKAPQHNSQTEIRCMTVYNNTLYGGTYPNSKLFEWNDVDAWVEVADQEDVSEHHIIDIIEFNGDLFGCTATTGRLYRWNGIDSWVQAAGSIGKGVYSLEVYNGNLYGGTGTDATLVQWNGVDSWVQVAPRFGSTGTIVRGLLEYNGKLYGGVDGSGELLVWNDNDAWTLVCSKHDTQSAINCLTEFDGNLYGGSGSSVELLVMADEAMYNTRFTIETWMYPTELGRRQYLVDKHSGSTNYFLAFWEDNKIRFTGMDLSDNDVYSNKVFGSGDLNKWWHVVGVYNGTHKAIYINGTVNNVEPTTGNMDIADTYNLTIGTEIVHTYQLNGNLDETRVYSRGLDEYEVSRLYNNYLERMGGSYNIRKYVANEPVSALGSEESTIASSPPTPKLLSQTPATIYQNSTGYMNISYGITHDSSGLNNTSVSFIFRNYDHTLNDANHSIRPPANDKCEMWNFDGKIMRAANRNETLNFENNDTITGGDIFTWSGLDENNTRLTIAPVNSTYTIVHINGTIHDLAMEQMWYLDRTDMVESPKTQLSIHKTQDVLIKFWNAEIFKGNYDFIGIGYTDTSLNSAPSLQPSDATPVSFYYLNSSYDPLSGVDPLDSGYAVFMGSMNATQWVDHVYSPDQNASYVRGAINNTLLNSVIDTTGISYLYFKSETPSSKPYYINITDASTNTNRTFGQTDVLWIGNTAPYTAHPYTPNAWFAFVYESTSFDHKLYVADNNDKWGNSTLQSTNIGAGLFPPTIPTIHHFNFNGSADYDKNKTYSETIDVGIGVGTDPDGGTVTHNLTLHYANKTFVAIINNTFTDAGIIGNGVYSNISFNTTPYYSETEEYTLKVVATDDEGETSESWSCCNFTLGTHQISNLHTTTLVYDRIVWGWTNPDHYDTIMVYLDNIWKQNTTGTSYSASGLNQETAYTIKLITVYAGVESDPVTDTQVTTTEQGGSGGGGGTPEPTPTPTATPTITPLPGENVTENVSIAIEPIPEITEEITSNYTVTGSIWHLSFDKHAVFIPEHSNVIACDAIPPYACRYYEDQKKFEIVIDGESPEPIFKADQWVTFITRDGKRISQRIDTKVYNPLFYFTMPAISGSVGDFSRYFMHGNEYMVDGVRFWWLGMLGIGVIAWRWRRRNV